MLLIPAKIISGALLIDGFIPTCEPSIALTTFGRLVKSENVSIDEFTSASKSLWKLAVFVP